MRSTSPSTYARVMTYFIDTLVVVPVAVLIIVALLISLASMTETLRFARATDQILSLVDAARGFSDHEPLFASQVGQDIVTTLAHAGLIATIVDAGPSAQLINPWQNNITALTSAPFDMRIETTIPVSACRRLAVFFSGHVNDLGLHIMEAREGPTGGWRRFYDNKGQVNVDEKIISASCGTTSPASLAMVFRLKG
jgi:hypothetical protein